MQCRTALQMRTTRNAEMLGKRESEREAALLTRHKPQGDTQAVTPCCALAPRAMIETDSGCARAAHCGLSTTGHGGSFKLRHARTKQARDKIDVMPTKARAARRRQGAAVVPTTLYQKHAGKMKAIRKHTVLPTTDHTTMMLFKDTLTNSDELSSTAVNTQRCRVVGSAAPCCTVSSLGMKESNASKLDTAGGCIPRPPRVSCRL
mmetsp:Transcript_28257/g.51005  ORF Transcript_28257/g.51005 Transcript_28257/m.51005 type:complete len:205 (+) Transcript_28257:64-678(+)